MWLGPRAPLVLSQVLLTTNVPSVLLIVTPSKNSTYTNTSTYVPSLFEHTPVCISARTAAGSGRYCATSVKPRANLCVQKLITE